jgi:hypothetical protein
VSGDEFNLIEEIDDVEESKHIDQEIHHAEMIDHVEEQVVGIQKGANEVEEEAAQAAGGANHTKEDSADETRSTTPEQARSALTPPDSLTKSTLDSWDILPTIVSP